MTKFSSAPRRVLVGVGVALLGVLSAVIPSGTAVAAGEPVATALSISASATRLTYGPDLTIQGRLTAAVAGTPVPAAEVSLLARRPGRTTAYTVLATQTTDADGVVQFVRKPTSNYEYVLGHAGSALTVASQSAARTVTVAPKISATIPTAARVGANVTIRGSVAPARPGQTVRVERYYSGAWHAVTSRTLSPTSTFSATITTPSSRGWRSYRVTKAATSVNLAGVTNLPRLDNYLLHTYVVRTKGTITVNMTEFAASAAATYADARGWVRGHHRFKRVSTGGNFTLVMSQAKYLPTYDSICSVQYSCRAGRYVVINQDRWRSGSQYFPGPLGQYRQMVVDHETGHWLGNRHRFCGGAGKLAPVMQQQSKGMQGCKPNAWPLSYEL